ncbi:hypothetical protein HDU96_005622 [Phlyctochytrium bullatum]|nr:hypothetical protein HDU96_005622 [Phlyctochytrium bullatum]
MSFNRRQEGPGQNPRPPGFSGSGVSVPEGILPPEGPPWGSLTPAGQQGPAPMDHTGFLPTGLAGDFDATAPFQPTGMEPFAHTPQHSIAPTFDDLLAPQGHGYRPMIPRPQSDLKLEQPFHTPRTPGTFSNTSNPPNPHSYGIPFGNERGSNPSLLGQHRNSSNPTHGFPGNSGFVTPSPLRPGFPPNPIPATVVPFPSHSQSDSFTPTSSLPHLHLYPTPQAAPQLSKPAPSTTHSEVPPELPLKRARSPKKGRTSGKGGHRCCAFCVRRKIRCGVRPGDVSCTSCIDRGQVCSFVTGEVAEQPPAADGTKTQPAEWIIEPVNPAEIANASRGRPRKRAKVVAPESEGSRRGSASGSTDGSSASPASASGTLVRRSPVGPSRLLTPYDDLDPLPPEEMRHYFARASFQEAQATLSVFDKFSIANGIAAGTQVPVFLTLALEAVAATFCRRFDEADAMAKRAGVDAVMLLAGLTVDGAPPPVGGAALVGKRGGGTPEYEMTMSVLQAMVCLSAYGIMTGNTGEGNAQHRWLAMAIVCARQMGLNKEAPWMDPLERERRRRIWWFLFIIDSLFAVFFDMTPIMRDDEAVHLRTMGCEYAWFAPELTITDEDAVFWGEALSALDLWSPGSTNDGPTEPEPWAQGATSMHTPNPSEASFSNSGSSPSSAIRPEVSLPPISSPPVSNQDTAETIRPLPQALRFFWARELLTVTLSVRAAALSRRLWPPNPGAPPPPPPDACPPVRALLGSIDTWTAAFEAFHEVGAPNTRSGGPYRQGRFSRAIVWSAGMMATSPRWAVDAVFADGPATAVTAVAATLGGAMRVGAAVPKEVAGVHGLLKWWAAGSPHVAECRRFLDRAVAYWRELGEVGGDIAEADRFADRMPGAPKPGANGNAVVSVPPKFYDLTYSFLGMLQFDLLYAGRIQTVLDVYGETTDPPRRDGGSNDASFQSFAAEFRPTGKGKSVADTNAFETLNRAAQGLSEVFRGFKSMWAQIVAVRMAMMVAASAFRWPRQS